MLKDTTVLHSVPVAVMESRRDHREENENQQKFAWLEKQIKKVRHSCRG